MKVDKIDIQILEHLQENARMTLSEISEKVGLSLPPLRERVIKLEEHNIIEGYHTKVSRHYFGFDIMVFIVVISESSKHYDELKSMASAHPNVLECHAILGDGSHLIKAIAKNTSALETLLSEIQSWPGVLSTKTNFVLSSSKETMKLDTAQFTERAL